MTRSKDLSRLSEVAQLLLDAQLGQLRQVAVQLDRSRKQLEAINCAAKPADLPVVAAEMVGLAYDRWADVRRSELNLVIARQTAEWIETRVEAGTALGRLQALQGLEKRLKSRR
jgi:hypothetical protein